MTPRPHTLGLFALLLCGCTVMFASACGTKEELPELQVKQEQEASRSRVVREAAPAPSTETAVIDAVVAAMDARDFSALKRYLAPELAADLHRIHRSDPGRFWHRGQRFVANVKTGLTIVHRDDKARGSWRVLLRFGNAQEERMVFTRVEGQLLIKEF